MPATLAEQLGYRLPPANAFQRMVWTVTGTRGGAWLFARSAHHLDRGMLRLTGGRSTAAGVIAGLPPVFVTMTGARSGVQRTVPLIGIPSGGDIGLIGTRFGQSGTPAWYFNLKKTPEVQVRFGGVTAPAIAREVEGDAHDAVWEEGCRLYPGYAAYARRITDRAIHIMVLSAR